MSLRFAAYIQIKTVPSQQIWGDVISEVQGIFTGELYAHPEESWESPILATDTETLMKALPMAYPRLIRIAFISYQDYLPDHPTTIETTDWEMHLTTPIPHSHIKANITPKRSHNRLAMNTTVASIFRHLPCGIPMKIQFLEENHATEVRTDI